MGIGAAGCIGARDAGRFSDGSGSIAFIGIPAKKRVAGGFGGSDGGGVGSLAEGVPYYLSNGNLYAGTSEFSNLLYAQ